MLTRAWLSDHENLDSSIVKYLSLIYIFFDLH